MIKSLGVAPFLFYFLLIIQSNSAYTQASEINKTGEIRGNVIDKFTSKPLNEFDVIISNSNLIVQKEKGLFSINKIPTGTFSITIDSRGFETKRMDDIVVLPSKITEINFELIPLNLQSVDTINIRANSITSFSNRNVSSFEFSREEISSNPGAQGDIFRAIGMLPGVTSSGGIYSAIAVRGQGVRDNVYLVDDIPLTEVGHLEGNSFFNDPNGGRFSIFAPRVIENAHFQGGAFSSEYGRKSASYLGLTIKEGNKFNGIFDGQIDLLGLNVNYDGPSGFNKRTTLFVSARYQNFLPLVKVIGLENLGLPIYGDLIVKSTTQLNANNKLKIIGMICPESFVRTVENVVADELLNLLYLPNFKRNKSTLGINLLTQLGKNQMRNVVYFNRYTSDVKVGKAFPQIDSNLQVIRQNIPFIDPIQTQDYNESKWGIRSLYFINFTKNMRIHLGIESEYIRLSNNRKMLFNDTNFIFRRDHLIDPTANFQIVTKEQVNASRKLANYTAAAFVNYYFNLGSKLNIQSGIRIESFGFSKQLTISPRISLNFSLTNSQQITLASGIYYQEPVYSDLADLPESETLGLEKIIQTIVSYKLHLNPNLKFMAEFWYKDFDNIIVTPIASSVLRNNNGFGWGRGIDLSLNQKLNKKWHGIISYSYMDVKINDGDGLGYYPFTFSQPHQFNSMLSYKLNKNWSFSGKFRFATGRPMDNYIIHKNVLNSNIKDYYSMELKGKNQGRLPNFTSIDLRVNYAVQVSKFRIISFFDVVNIMNKQIANNLNFNHVLGKPFYDGLAIFPTGGMKFEF